MINQEIKQLIFKINHLTYNIYDYLYINVWFPSENNKENTK